MSVCPRVLVEARGGAGVVRVRWFGADVRLGSRVAWWLGGDAGRVLEVDGFAVADRDLLCSLTDWELLGHYGLVTVELAGGVA